MDITLFGIVILLKLLHPEKASVPISVTLSEILILFKRFDKYYLYVVYQTNDKLNAYESIGLFTSNNNISLNKEIANIKIKMDA